MYWFPYDIVVAVPFYGFRTMLWFSCHVVVPVLYCGFRAVCWYVLLLMFCFCSAVEGSQETTIFRVGGVSGGIGGVIISEHLEKKKYAT